MKRVHFLALAPPLATVVSLASEPAARADIPAPACEETGALITCAAADVGKPCQGGGQCYATVCVGIGSANTLYKCDACPTVLATSSVTCSTINVGTPCDTGAYCTVLSAWCGGTDPRYVCARPAFYRPTGPPAGEASPGVDGACAVGPAAGSTPGIAGGLAVIGLAFLALSRRRRGR